MDRDINWLIQTNPSRVLAHGHYHHRLPFVTPEERAREVAENLAECASSSDSDYQADFVSTRRARYLAWCGRGPRGESQYEADLRRNINGGSNTKILIRKLIAQIGPSDDVFSHRTIFAGSVKGASDCGTINKGKFKESAILSSFGPNGKAIATIAMSELEASGVITSPSGEQHGGVSGGIDKNAAVGLRKVKKQKVLLMGKSGSGKSSMRSIIFSNYLARDTRRLGATIDIDLSHVKFLGNLTLNLWDCGGQEAFMENYLSQQRAHVFTNVGVLIYVFDIESRDVDRDLATYVNIASALFQYSREAKVFVLIHKMDLIQPSTREAVFDGRVAAIRRKTAEAIAIVRKQKSPAAGSAVDDGAAGFDLDLDMQAFATSIWDQSLYKAWASIIHDLVPNLSMIETQLASLGRAIDADEILLFERTSFLVVSRWSSEEGSRNPYGDRYERLSNILKAWKHTCSKYTGTPRNAEQFTDFEYKAGTSFGVFVTKFTTNTYVLVCMPPGEARFNSAKLNVAIARSWFKFLDGPVQPPAAPQGLTSSSAYVSGAAGAEGGTGAGGGESGVES